MYGNYEYGSVPYGDVSTIVIIPISEASIEILFISGRKIFSFLSERKDTFFTSYDLRTTIFNSSFKETPFISLKKISTFKSEDIGKKRPR